MKVKNKLVIELFDYEESNKSAVFLFQENYKNRYKQRGYYKSVFKKDSKQAKEAFIKVIHHKKSDIKKSIEYIQQKEKSTKDQEVENTLNQNKVILYNLFGEKMSEDEKQKTISLWKRKTENDTGRNLLHMIFSIDETPTSKNLSILKNSLTKIQSKYFFGYDSVFALHKDTEKAHAHLLIQTKNIYTEKKIRIGKAELFHIRKDFAENLRHHGLNYVATLNYDSMRKKEKSETKNYLLSKAYKFYGREGELFFKKMFIQVNHQDKNKKIDAYLCISQFKSILSSFDKKTDQEIRKQIYMYSIQREKYFLKQELQEKYSSNFNPSLIKNYVDWVYASKIKYIKNSNIKNKSSLEDIKKKDLKIEKLKSQDITSELTFFKRYRDNKQRQQKMIDNSPFGEVGKQVLKSSLKVINHPNSNKNIKKKAKQVVYDFFDNKIEQKKLKELQKYYIKKNLNKFDLDQDKMVEQLKTIKNLIVEETNEDIDNLKEVSNIFKVYLLKSNDNFEKGYQFLNKNINQYIDILKSNDDQQLKEFSKKLKLSLGEVSTYQKDKKQKLVSKGFKL